MIGLALKHKRCLMTNGNDEYINADRSATLSGYRYTIVVTVNKAYYPSHHTNLSACLHLTALLKYHRSSPPLSFW